MTATVLVSDPIHPDALALLRERGFTVLEKTGLDDEALAAEVARADAWIIRSGTRATAPLIEAGAQLKVIGRAGIGVDNIDVEAATRRGIPVLNTPTGNTTAAVEHSLALLLSLVRNVPQAHQSLAVERTWSRSKFTGTELFGKTIGVLGLGRIGSRVAARCRAFEMTVLAYDPFLTPRRASELGVELVRDLDALLARCDVLTLHLPLTAETTGLLDAARLTRTRPGVRIVNCARGGLIDEAALADALRSGQVAGAAIDVFDAEPALDSPLLDAPNVVLTPHLGASTVESQRNVGVQIAEQVADALERGVFRQAINLPVRDWAIYEQLGPEVELVSRLGQVAASFVEGAISRIEVAYLGGAFAELDALDNALLQGLLRAQLGERVNPVNASLIAAERGIELVHSTSAAAPDYHSLVRITLHEDGRDRTFAATCFHDAQPRIVELDGFALEFVPQGVLLLFVNIDRPGVIGDVGTQLGRHQVNIANFTLGRTTRGGEALAVLQIDEPLSPDVAAELLALDNMKWIRQINLD